MSDAGTTYLMYLERLHEEWVRRGKPRDAAGKPTLRNPEELPFDTEDVA